MTAPHVSGIVAGRTRVTYFTTAIDESQGPGPFATVPMDLRDNAGALLTTDTDSGVVLVIGFWTAVNASGILPTVTSITGGGLTWHRYIDPYQDGLVPSPVTTSNPLGRGQMGTELWWTYSNDPLPPSTTFSLTWDPPISYASNKGVMYCGGVILSGCATPSSPWDARLDLPASQSLAPVSPPGAGDTLVYMLSNGTTVLHAADVYHNTHIHLAGSALVGSDGDELALVMGIYGSDDSTLTSVNPYASLDWSSPEGGSVSSNFGVPGTVGWLDFKTVQSPIPTNMAVVLFPPTGA